MNLSHNLARTESGHHLVLLAPDAGHLPSTFRKAMVDPRQYDALLGAMQRMRGSIYLNDGAIHHSQLESDGRHVVDSDRRSWHVLSINSAGQVEGCSRYLEHPHRTPFASLIASRAAIASHPVYGAMFSDALRAQMEFARKSGLAFAEVGGWAVQDKLRFTTEALRIALTTFALARWLGGCIGITTATVRHCSSRILRKIGGAPLDAGAMAIPSYFDPQYQCEMELLRFDSRSPSPRFQSWINTIFNQLAEAPVVWRNREATALQPFETSEPVRYRTARASR